MMKKFYIVKKIGNVRIYFDNFGPAFMPFCVKMYKGAKVTKLEKYEHYEAANAFYNKLKREDALE